MHLCTCVSEERGGGESTGSEVLSLLSYTLRYVSLSDLKTDYDSLETITDEPVYMCE